MDSLSGMPVLEPYHSSNKAARFISSLHSLRNLNISYCYTIEYHFYDLNAKTGTWLGRNFQKLTAQSTCFHIKSMCPLKDCYAEADILITTLMHRFNGLPGCASSIIKRTICTNHLSAAKRYNFFICYLRPVMHKRSFWYLCAAITKSRMHSYLTGPEKPVFVSGFF